MVEFIDTIGQSDLRIKITTFQTLDERLKTASSKH